MEAQIINADQASQIIQDDGQPKYEISEAQSMLLKFWPTVSVALQNQNTVSVAVEMLIIAESARLEILIAG